MHWYVSSKINPADVQLTLSELMNFLLVARRLQARKGSCEEVTPTLSHYFLERKLKVLSCFAENPCCKQSTPPDGFEPSTDCLEGSCSIQLS